MDATKKYKVKLSQQPSLAGPDNSVEFTATPRISEGRSATYDELAILHHPGGILKYKTTASRTWSINAKLISRNIKEASQNLKYTNLIRSWVMPFYGVGTGNDPNTQKYLGAPPPILTLTAYGEKMIGPVKCVLESYNWEWPDDIDYISTDEKYPFPAILSLSLNLKESFSPAEYSGFNFIKYRNGELTESFSSVVASSPPAKRLNNAPSSVNLMSQSRDEPKTIEPQGQPSQ